MSIIKIDGSTLTSHQGASDITDVVNTSQITEGSNLYYTEARVNANFATKTTTDLTEGTNLYFTNARAVDALEDEATIDLNSLIVNSDSSLAYPWKTLELKADRRTTAPVNNDANDIYWSARTPNATVSLGLIEIKTDNVTLDGNNDYTVFDNRLDFIVTSMTGGTTSFHNPVSMKKNLINVNTALNSIDNSFFVGGSYGSLVDSTRIETNSGKWNTSRSGARCKTNATTDATGTTLSQFSDNFASDINVSLNNSEVGAFSIAVLSPDFNADNTLAYGNGQKSELNMLLRGDGHGVFPETALQALSIQPWDNQVTFNTATGTDNLLLETNAIGFEFDKLVTVKRDASGSQAWKSFVIQHDRSNATPISNQASDIVWTAKTTNQQPYLGAVEMVTKDVVLDANDDYTDFSNSLEFYTTSMSGGAVQWRRSFTIDKDKIDIKNKFQSFNQEFIVGGEYSYLVDNQRIETNNTKWERSRTALRATTNADYFLGAGLEQFSTGFGCDTNYSINNSEISTIGVQVNDPDFNGDNTLAYGNGQAADFRVQLRGDGYAPGQGPLQALEISPWTNRIRIDTATGTNNLRIETNAPAVEDTKPHVFVNLTTTERNALTAESGMMIFNTTDVKLQCYDGTAWNNLH